MVGKVGSYESPPAHVRDLNRRDMERREGLRVQDAVPNGYRDGGAGCFLGLAAISSAAWRCMSVRRLAGSGPLIAPRFSGASEKQKIPSGTGTGAICPGRRRRFWQVRFPVARWLTVPAHRPVDLMHRASCMASGCFCHAATAPLRHPGCASASCAASPDSSPGPSPSHACRAPACRGPGRLPP